MIPIILGAAALATGAIGALKGAEGVGNMNQAKEIGEQAQQRYESSLQNLKAAWEITNQSAEVYGQMQLRIKQGTISNFIAFIERIGQRASQNNLDIIAGLDVSTQQIQEYKTEVIKAQEWVKGGVSAAVAASTAGSSAVTLAMNVGKVPVSKFFGLWTSEVAISQLGGSAALKATIAWLGGSSMAVGSAVLGGITLGPALMAGGFQLAGKGEEALTKAREYEANVNVEIANIEAAQDFLLQVKRRTVELANLVCNLNNRAKSALQQLEAQPFDRDRDASKFQEVALLIKALAEIMKISILDNEGMLNPTTLTIQAKYRTLGGI
ncbi:hypothetical protein FNW02_13695 [Komarekiella sp. 'clone 1']|uniref:Uncharacterized protein n=1 Tax=Komarekiella delphini-convector SJRDD-AB1 TaxID=2593771 RepID=A0AA40SXK3_9NOST|nr:hypothetical protein [Komarekiella delphini-convector]MBD6616852.1 hypothetical protein [Komarekiella delphini-convector SJRDD-AB1]